MKDRRDKIVLAAASILVVAVVLVSMGSKKSISAADSVNDAQLTSAGSQSNASAPDAETNDDVQRAK